MSTSRCMSSWFLSGTLAFLWASGADALGAPVKIILDTDVASDCDDLGAIAVLHNYANQGKAEILGMVCDVSDDRSPLCLSAINTYYGRKSISIGCVTTDYVSPCVNILFDIPYFYVGANRFTDYIADTRNYDRGFLSNPVPDALDVYRDILKNNTNVTIVSIGSLYHLDRLLKEEPVLVSDSVAKLVVMGGQYPFMELRPDFNFSLWCDAAQRVVANWPTPIIFTGLGGDIITGAVLMDDAKVATNNPIRVGYKLGTEGERLDTSLKGESQGPYRPSWDPIAVVYAVEGAGSTFAEHNGINSVVPVSFDLPAIPFYGTPSITLPCVTNAWTDSEYGRHRYLSLVQPDPSTMSNHIENLMTGPTVPTPTDLSANAFSLNEIVLVWKDEASNEVGCKIERGTDGETFEEIGFTMGGSCNSFSDVSPDLVPGVRYYYRVRAFDDKGHYSYCSVPASAMLSEPSAPLVLGPAPYGFVPNTTPVLQSSAISYPDGVTHANSQWQVSRNTGFTGLAWDAGESFPASTSTTVPSGLLAYNTTYYWRVRYKDSHGVWSPWSAVGAFKTIESGDYEYSTGFDHSSITSYTGPGGNVTIPPTINGLPVISIGSYAFNT
ncbi:MAG: nucleoside hydrolase, partial [Kiritimatiellae bacterium]|nr:nucleoside hydrolase [Kiritimatiellia bacterium]